MTNKVLGGGFIDGYIGTFEDLADLNAPNGRTLQGYSAGNEVQFWYTSDTLEAGGYELASGNYANPRVVNGVIPSPVIKYTTTDLINSSLLNIEVGESITTTGFYTEGDGGGAQWVLSELISVASKGPLQLQDTKIADSLGRVWGLSYDESLNLNTIGMSKDLSCGEYITLGCNKIRESRFVTIGGTGATMPLKITANHGNYFTDTSINAQLLDGMSWAIDLGNIDILAKCSGKTVLDLLGSRFGTVRIGIVGDETNKPAIGIQYGRLFPTINADNLKFDNVRTRGFFTRSSAYNLSSETEEWDHLQLYNYEATEESYVHIWDGNNTWGAITDYQEPDIDQYTPMSNIQHTFISPDWRKVDGGNALWVCRAKQWKTYNGYAVSANGYAAVLSDDGNGFEDFHFDVHVEKEGVAGAISFELNPASPFTTVNVRRFKHIDHGAQFANRIYNIDTSVTKVYLRDSDVSLPKLTFTPLNGLVVPVSKLVFVGDIYCSNGSIYKGFEAYGDISSDDPTTGNYGAGTYTITDSNTGTKWHKGEHRFVGTKASNIVGSQLSSLDSSAFSSGLLQPPILSDFPIVTPGKAAIAVDDGSNWSNANPSGTPKPVFYNGATWSAMF